MLRDVRRRDNLLQVTLCRLSYVYIFRNMCICMYVYVWETTIDEKGSHGFERDQVGVYGKVWREQRQGEVIWLYYDLKMSKK